MFGHENLSLRHKYVICSLLWNSCHPITVQWETRHTQTSYLCSHSSCLPRLYSSFPWSEDETGKRIDFSNEVSPKSWQRSCWGSRNVIHCQFTLHGWITQEKSRQKIANNSDELRMGARLDFGLCVLGKFSEKLKIQISWSLIISCKCSVVQFSFSEINR